LNSRFKVLKNHFALLFLGLMLSACDSGEAPPEAAEMSPVFELSALVKERKLDEISGIQLGADADFFVHNDEGKPLLHVVNTNGQHMAAIHIKKAKNRDWEDITRIPRETGNLLVIGDTGDNNARHKSARLFFVEEPRRDENGRYPEKIKLEHKLKIRYPDGPRDCESIAWDSASEQILFMSKRDVPPRLYGLSLDVALDQEEVELEFLAELPPFRPPTRKDILLGGKRGGWVSQPTGMDISADGTQLAVITYRSLYLWSREEGESWPQALQRAPAEFVGPPGLHDEAVSFGSDQNEVYVTTEGVPAPIYRFTPPLTPKIEPGE
jgi:hypothetical protein